jgi:hypothetical protein
MKKFVTRSRFVCLLAITLFSFAAVSFAQSTRGELAGSVTDASGAVVPGAHVVAVNSDTGAKSETTSTSSGSYHFTELSIGRYSVTVTAPGFSVATNNGVQVTVNSTSSLNVILKAGAVTETVTVDASGSRIETESSDIGGTISARQITELPLAIAGGVGALRSPENFAFLVPGTTGPGAGGPQGLNGNGVFFAKLGGGQSFGAEVLLDGASVTRSENGSSFDETAPSVESLQEFKVTTATPTAEFGRTTGGTESFVTKGGTNQFHGTVFDIFINDALNSNGWFEHGLRAACAATDTGCLAKYKTAVNRKNDYGGTIGGPVRLPHLYNGTDRTFFFFSWEQYRQELSAVSQATVPTTTGGTTGLGERGGDFSAVLGGPTSVNGQPLLNPCTGQPVLQNQIFDPATTSSATTATNLKGIPCRLPFAGNIIPQSRFSASALKLITALPAPNQASTPNAPYGFFNNYTNRGSFPILNTTETIRIDQSITQKSKIWASYSVRDNNRTGVDNLPPPLSQTVPQDFNTHYTRAGWDYTFTPNLLNHINLGYNRTNSLNYAPTIGGPNYAAQAGVGNIVANAFPVINFDGLDSFTGYASTQNGDNIDNGIRANDSVSWQKGRHSFKFGIDFRYQQYSTLQKSVPTINFLRSETDVARLPNTPQFQSGNSFASLLLGQVDNSAQTAYIHSPRWNSHYIGGFVQDDFKASPNLTLNLGLRYDVDSPRHEAENDTSNFSLTAPDPHANNLPGALVFGKTCNCNSAWADTYFKDIAPRLGFAYLLPGTNGKAVVRGGVALLYGALQYTDFGTAMSAGYSVPVNTGSPDQFTPAFKLDSGFPQAFPTAANLDPGQLDNGTFPAVGTGFISKGMGRPAMTTNWSFQLQDELAQDLILTIGYVGQSAQNLRSSLENINNIPLNDFSFGDHLTQDTVSAGHPADGISAPYPTFNQQLYRALRPFPQYDFIATDCCLQNVGHSSYDALVVSMNRRFRQGFNLQASYTWAKNLTDADSSLPNTSPGALQQDQNIFNHRLEKSVSISNIPHTFVLSYLYELPFGRGRKFFNNNTLLNYLVGGWQIGGIQRYQSGQPVSFGCATGIPGYQNCIRFSRGAATNIESATYQRDKLHSSSFNGQSWFNAAYRPAVAPTQNTPGDPGVSLSQAGFVDVNRYFRNGGAFTLGQGVDRVTSNVTSPLYLSEDFSLIKKIPITEGVRFELKVEAIDAFNRHNFNIPDLVPSDPTFGVPQIGSIDLGPRVMQITGRITF